MNNVRISGRAVQVDNQPAVLQFLLQFRTTRDCYVLIKVYPPLVREKLQDLKPGCLVRVVGILKSEDANQLFVDAFSVLPDDHQKFMQEQRNKFLSGVMP